jgi:hypothetical protein
VSLEGLLLAAAAEEENELLLLGSATARNAQEEGNEMEEPLGRDDTTGRALAVVVWRRTTFCGGGTESLVAPYRSEKERHCLDDIIIISTATFHNVKQLPRVL